MTGDPASTRYRVNTPNVLHESIDGEAVIINLLSGNYYSLNPSGTIIWGLVTELAPTAEELSAAVRQRFSDPATVQDGDILAWMAELEHEELLVRLSDEEAARVPSRPQASDAGGEPASIAYTPPRLETFTDMQEFLLVDPIHEVDDSGWPGPAAGSPEVVSSADSRP